MRYVASMIDFGLVPGGNLVVKGLVGFSDVDFAGCVESLRSTSGVVFLLHEAALRSSKIQRLASVSTMEA